MKFFPVNYNNLKIYVNYTKYIFGRFLSVESACGGNNSTSKCRAYFMDIHIKQD